MAAPNLTSGECMDVYRRMFLLNCSFHLIVQRLDEITQTRVVSPADQRNDWAASSCLKKSSLKLTLSCGFLAS
jgi:hypothetical protein